MEKIDKSCWARKEIFDFFSPLTNPFYSVTFRMDVTELYDYAKKNGLPSTIPCAICAQRP